MASIEYRFVASGHQSVERAFQGIEQAARRSAKTVEASYAGQERAARRSATVQEREARRPVSRLEQLAKQVERDQARAAQREVQTQARAVQHVQKIRERYFADQQRQNERTAVQAVRSEQRASKLRERVMAAEARVRDRMSAANARREEQHQHHLARGRETEAARERLHQDRLTRIRQSSVRQIVRQREDANMRLDRARDRVAESRRGAMYGAIGGVLRGAVIGGGGAALALGAGVGGAAVKDAYALQSIANRISINSRKSGQEFMDPTRLRKEFEATALATRGVVSAEDVATGTQAFISKTGNIGQARKFMPTFATTAAATGSSFSDIANAGAELAKKFSLETAEQMQEALASVTFGGKEGAFEISDAAQKYAKLASAGAKFGLDKGVGGVKVLQGLSQIAMDSTGDRDVAATGVESMLRQLVVESGRIKALNNGMGPDVFTDDTNTKTNPIEKLLPDVIAAAGGDLLKLQKIFGDEGSRGINPLITTFNDAFTNATGANGKNATEAERVAAGKAAVSKHLMGAINAPGTFKDLQMDAEQAVSTPDKMAASWERITAAVGDKLLPVLDRMADRLEVSDGAIDTFVGTLEVLLEMLESFGMAFGLIKNPMESKEYRQKIEKGRIKRAEQELAAMPSDEKAAALAAAGDTAGAAAMYKKMNDPSVVARRHELLMEKAIAGSKIEEIANIDRTAAKATKLGSDTQSAQQFQQIYAGLGANGNSAEAQVRANIMAHALAANPANDTYSTKDFIPGENADQRAARLGFAQGQAERKIQFGGKGDESGSELAAKGLEAILMRITKSAGPAAQALEKLGSAAQPSISSG